MRFLELHIERWRNFRDIQMEVPPDATLVCLVGDNGTGKSNILELLSASANRLGISAGVDFSRGDPFADDHAFSVRLSLVDDPQELFDSALSIAGINQAEWDRTICLSSRGENGGMHLTYSVGGISDPDVSSLIATRVIEQLRTNQAIHHLHLDADRAYPPLELQAYQYAEALSIEWDLIELLMEAAFRPTRRMYEEWLRYLLARESQFATRYISAIRRAQESDTPNPPFIDPFATYKASVATVLPHLRFGGVDTERRTLVFDSAGASLAFSSLSGGEREIAFLIGQIERFRLRRGLLLLDEPELHLNPNLVRTWLAYLRETIEVGQVWIATHSLEAVEISGQEATFMLERTEDTRTVERASPLGSRPVITALSKALGTPAYSLAGRRFVFVEGDVQTTERERFYHICGNPTVNRFIEGGSCEEVVRKVAVMAELAKETDEQLHVGGVIDRDFRTARQIAELRGNMPVHVLGCHEIENLFLEPTALARLLKRQGRDPDTAQEILCRASDALAGLWILQRAAQRNRELHSELPVPLPAMRAQASKLKWCDFDGRTQEQASAMASADPSISPEIQEALAATFAKSVEAYEHLRKSPSLWKECLGKQVLAAIPTKLGASNATSVERQVAVLWEQAEVEPPEEVRALCTFVESLSA